ncbi:MAG TPA: hypothetical protein VHL57_12650, partial [Flavobacteriales bacterium]|nr:hypothetical protein [Flavobacteriales bacterium]
MEAIDQRATSTPAQVVEVVLTAFAVALPLAPGLLPLLLGLLLISSVWAWIVEGRPMRTLSWHTVLPWTLVLYAAHLLGLLWTTNMDFAGLDLGIKAPLALFPLLFMLHTRPYRSDRILRAFVQANTAAVVYCLLHAVYSSAAYMFQVKPYQFLSGYTASVPFFSSEFARFLHPSYMAMYLGLALVLLFRAP